MSSRLYAVWRTAVEAVRERLLGEPQLSLKTRRACYGSTLASHGGTEA